jgi:hypothetical protein
MGEEKVTDMPTTKKGQKEIRVVLDEGCEIQTTLLEWAQKRGLTSGKATRCILADWSDALNGRPNPFAVAIAAAAGISVTAGPGQVIQTAAPAQEPKMSAEEKARQDALLQAAEQFM